MILKDPIETETDQHLRDAGLHPPTRHRIRLQVQEIRERDERSIWVNRWMLVWPNPLKKSYTNGWDEVVDDRGVGYRFPSRQEGEKMLPIVEQIENALLARERARLSRHLIYAWWAISAARGTFREKMDTSIHSTEAEARETMRMLICQEESGKRLAGLTYSVPYEDATDPPYAAFYEEALGTQEIRAIKPLLHLRQEEGPALILW